MTLDGVMEAPGGEPTHPHTGWVGDDEAEEQIAFKFHEVLEAETLLVGRVPEVRNRVAWRLTDSRTFSSGVRADTYRPA